MDNYSLLRHNTFGIDARACRYEEYASEDELRALLQNDLPRPLLHIGAGSNLLFVTPFFEGTVLHSAIRGMEVVREDDEWVWLRVGAGCTWDDVPAYCVAHQWYGAENLSLIPGEVGASAVQNIGAYGAEVKDLIAQVETVDASGQKHVFGVDECAYGYRDSLFKRPDMKKHFVTYVTYRLGKVPRFNLSYGALQKEVEACSEVTLQHVRQAVIDIRRRKLPDPAQLGNAGSFFKNPVVDRPKFESLSAAYPDMPYYALPDDRFKIPAGWLIEQCGWKGKSLGRAGVYRNQALILVNNGGATGREVADLAAAVCESVDRKFGITISPEVNFIN